MDTCSSSEGVVYIKHQAGKKKICFSDFLIAKYLYKEIGYANVRINGKRYWYNSSVFKKVESPFNKLDNNYPNEPHEIWLAAREYVKTIKVDGATSEEIDKAFEYHKISYKTLAGVLEDRDRDNISVYLRELLLGKSL